MPTSRSGDPDDLLVAAEKITRKLVSPATAIGAGERLTVRSLVTGPESKTRVAVVPTGQSALPGAHLPNELISLPTSLHAAGVSAVVSCLWEVSDLSARTLIHKFYSYWRERQIEPADALRAAQIWVRDVSSEELSRARPADSASGPSSRASNGEDRPFAAPIHWAGFVYSGM